MGTSRLTPLVLLAELAVACGSNSAGTHPATPAGTRPAAAGAGGTVVSPAAATTTAMPVRAASPTAAPVAGNLTVFAAASLTEPFNQLGAGFKQANPGVKVTFNFAASSALRTQMVQGARADVFASADQPTMDGARQDGSIDGTDQVFAKNKLVVVTPKSGSKVTAIQDLAKPGINLVLTDPSVPIGNYARQALVKMDEDQSFGPDFDQKVLANLKSQEANVKAVVSKVQLGEADAGICYASDVTPAAAKDVTAILIPDRFNVIATYPIAVAKGAPNRAAAQAFIAYVRSPAGQAVLQRNNFIVDADTGAAGAVVPREKRSHAGT